MLYVSRKREAQKSPFTWVLYYYQQVVFFCKHGHLKLLAVVHMCRALPGATMISCFFERILRKVKSFCGSMSLTHVRALLVS